MSTSLRRCLVTFAMLGMLIGALFIPTARADDPLTCEFNCGFDLGFCQYTCVVFSGTSPQCYLGCAQSSNSCVMGCGGGLSHQPLQDPNQGCIDNADRLYEMCLEGRIVPAFQMPYANCMANTVGQDMSACCWEAREHYLSMGCY